MYDTDFDASSVAIKRWSATLSVGLNEVVRSPNNGLSYERITAAGSSATDPSLDPTNYALVGPTRLRQRITSMTTFTVGSGSATAAISVLNPAKCRWRILAALSGGAAIVSLVSSVTITTTQITLNLSPQFGSYGVITYYYFEVEEDW